MPFDATSLQLRTHPDPLLRKRAAPITTFDDDLRAVAAEMIRIMRQHEGIGLAAPQVGLSLRLFVADVPPREDRPANSTPSTSTNGPVVYINPTLSNPQGGILPFEEGCLSLPDIRGDVMRPAVVTITAMDLDGKEFTATAGGLLARCWQHEIDHLDGILIIDKMTQMSRLRNRQALRDLERTD
jgi:peptide deformylase